MFAALPARAGLATNQVWYPLYVDALLGQPALVRYHLRHGADVHAQMSVHGATPLHVAAWAGEAEVASVLVEAGASVEARTVYGHTPLHLAASGGQADVVEVLLKAGADVQAVDGQGFSPAHLAARRGRTPVVLRLLEAGFNPETTNHFGETLLLLALRHQHRDLARALVARGARTTPDQPGAASPLATAAARGWTDLVQLMIDQGADVNYRGRQGRTAFLWAAYRNQLASMKQLQAAGADVNAVGDDHYRALALAVFNRNTEAVAWLASVGARLDDDGAEAQPPLRVAMNLRRGAEPLVKALLDVGVDPGRPYDTGWYPLHQAVDKSQRAVVDRLLKAGVDVAVTNRSGVQPIHLAADQPDLRILKALVAAGASVQARDAEGWAPLHMAAQNGRVKLVEYLLRQGVDPDAEGGGDRALKLAIYKGGEDVAKCLLDHGAAVDTPAVTNDWSPLNSAAWYNRSAIARLLIRRGADLNSQVASCQTPLFVAARRGSGEVLDLLLEAGADPLRRSKGGLVPWHIAVMNGQSDIARRLREAGGVPQPEESRVRVYVELDDPAARRVTVAGTFNEWNSDATPLRRDARGIWYRELELFNYPIEYKFVVDGQWIVDPGNPLVEYDKTRPNSVLIPSNRLVALRGQYKRPPRVRRYPVTFHLDSPRAEEVTVVGEFNGWSTDALPLHRGAEGWRAEARLPAGNYGYKFVVDDRWILDPANPEIKVVDDVTNSLLVVTAP